MAACKQAIEADPELYKAVATLAQADGGTSLERMARRFYAELGPRNLRDLIVIMKRVKDDREWRPGRVATLRAG